MTTTPQYLVRAVGSGGQLDINVLSPDDNVGYAFGTDSDAVFYLSSAIIEAADETTGLHAGTSVKQETAANSLIISNVTNDGDIQMLVSDNGNSKEFLLANGDTADLVLGHGMATATIKTASGDLTLNPGGDIDCSSNDLLNIALSGNDWDSTSLRVSTDVFIANSAGIIVGSATQETINADNPELQVLGTNTSDGTVAAVVAHTSNTLSPAFILGKNASGTLGTYSTAVADNEEVGYIGWVATDGSSFNTRIAELLVEVDDASPTTSHIGAAYVFSQMPADESGIRETMRLTAAGALELNGTSTSALNNVGAAGNDWTANTLTLNNDNAGAHNQIAITNTSTTAASRAVFQALVPATDNATVDAMVVLGVSAQFYWRMGVDNSESDRFAISANNTLGSDDALRITTAGAITFDNSAAYDATGETNHADADFDYVCDGCGKASIKMFDCCGKVEWHDDVLAVRESRLSPEGIQHMAKLGILEIDGPNDSDPGWIGINYQKAQNFTWAGMWQNRQRMDAQYEQLNKRLEAIGA